MAGAERIHVSQRANLRVRNKRALDFRSLILYFLCHLTHDAKSKNIDSLFHGNDSLENLKLHVHLLYNR